ncbi:hypothetical protein LIER_27157 [Lithospermum erythrorhizon]|uniref:Transposase (putative) gypsy type domain-containing protein n=1 Tax=Lithospermum erythrorhizon TaxID=34254 RepID=A0AAV3RB05_LITER
MRLPFSDFVNDLLVHINRAPGQIHPCGWINITIFQVTCQIARVQATVPLFDTSLSVWEAVQNSTDPTNVEVAAMTGRRFPCFSSQLLVRKLLVSGSVPVPIFPAKRRFNSEASSSVSKRAKLEALANISASILAPSTSPTEVISLDDELTISAQEIVDPKKKKYVPPIVTVRPPKPILPLLEKSGTSIKNGKGKSVSLHNEGSSLDYYSACYMKAPHSLHNGLLIEEGHLWTNRIDAFHAVHPLL